MLKKSFLIIPVFLFISLSSLYADLSLAGASLPYSNDWYRNPALQNKECPAAIFTAPHPIPVGLFALLNPKLFPYELVSGSISSDSDFDLLSLYIQLNNPLTVILNLPESPEEVYFYISNANIEIRDGNGERLPVSSIPGQGTFSLNETPLIPAPVFSFRLNFDNIFIGTGLFGGTSGISFLYNDQLLKIFDQMEIKPEDSPSFEMHFSSRAGVFEYINAVSAPLSPSDKIEIQFAGRLFLYQVLAEISSSYYFDIEVRQNYLTSEFESQFEMFYFYPGTGYGIGSRLDFGTVADIGNWRLGLSFLNLAGIEYSKGLRLADELYISDANFFYSFRPYTVFHISYFYENGKNLTLIPVLDLGYGKTFFVHSAVAMYWKDFCIKSGIAWEDRLKGTIAFGAGLKSFSIETGLLLQQSVFNNLLTGIYFTAGIE